MKQEKVFCKDCRWCYYDYDYECRNKETAEKKEDTFLEKGGDVVSYHYCYHLNQKNNCPFFEKKNWKYYLFLKFLYYKSEWFYISGFFMLLWVFWLILYFCLK